VSGPYDNDYSRTVPRTREELERLARSIWAWPEGSTGWHACLAALREAGLEPVPMHESAAGRIRLERQKKARRESFDEWLARLTGTAAWKEHFGASEPDPGVWRGFFEDGYAPEEALREEAR